MKNYTRITLLNGSQIVAVLSDCGYEPPTNLYVGLDANGDCWYAWDIDDEGFTTSYKRA